MGLFLSGWQPAVLNVPPAQVAFEDLAAFNRAQNCGQPLHPDHPDSSQHCPPCLAVLVWTAILPERPPSLCGPLGWQGSAFQDALLQPAFAVAHPSRAPPANLL